MQNVALMGLGVMGSGMARNLLKTGFPLTVYNRTRAKAEALAEAGARIADTPRHAAEQVDVVISMVGDDQASQAMWLGDDGALSHIKADTVLIECSTLSVAWMRELGELAVQRGALVLDAPVTGSKNEAINGSLRLLVGGDPEVVERVRPVLAAFSSDIVHMGSSGSGTLMKLVNNLMGAVQAVTLAEALTLAERAGMNMPQVLHILTNGSVASPIVKGKAARMVAHDYADTAFALQWMHKDATYALRAADEFGAALPTVAIAREVYRMARNLGLDEVDFSAVIEALRRE